MYDVITVGSSTVDVFAHTDYCEMVEVGKGKEYIAYPVGAKILIDELQFTCGGGGTNTAVSLSRLGHKVAFLGKMGIMENSKKIIEALKDEKVDTSLVVRSKKGRTGYSVILDSKKHDRTILIYRGSNNDLRLNEIKLKKLKAKWFFFSTMMETSFKTLESLSNYAVRNNIKVMLNISSYLAKQGPKFLRNLLKNTDVIVLNKEEACMLAGKGDVKKLLVKIHKLGPKIVAITDGRNGVYIYHENKMYTGMPNNIKVVETTGAGDAFASSFLSGIMRKNDIEFAMKLGMTNAESVIQHHGAKEKLLSYNEALKIMKKRPIKIVINNF